MTLDELQNDIKAINSLFDIITQVFPSFEPTNEIIKFLELADEDPIVQNIILLILNGISPTPVPTPTPSSQVATTLTFVVLSPNDNTASVTEDANFRVWLKSNNIAVCGINNQTDLINNTKFSGIQSPCIVLQDVNNKVIDSNPISSVLNAETFITKYLGGNNV